MCILINVVASTIRYEEDGSHGVVERCMTTRVKASRGSLTAKPVTGLCFVCNTLSSD